MQQEIQEKINKVAGVEAFVFAPPTLPGTSGGLPVQYIIRSTGDADKVFEVAEEIKERAQRSGRFIVVQNSLAFTQPQARVTIDRDLMRAADILPYDVVRYATDVRTHIETLYRERAGLHYVAANSADMPRVHDRVAEAIEYCRRTRRPVFFHLKTVRLMGHAGTDVDRWLGPVSGLGEQRRRHPARALSDSLEAQLPPDGRPVRAALPQRRGLETRGRRAWLRDGSARCCPGWTRRRCSRISSCG